jgi:hypothetical protein
MRRTANRIRSSIRIRRLALRYAIADAFTSLRVDEHDLVPIPVRVDDDGRRR